MLGSRDGFTWGGSVGTKSGGDSATSDISSTNAAQLGGGAGAANEGANECASEVANEVANEIATTAATFTAEHISTARLPIGRADGEAAQPVPTG